MGDFMDTSATAKISAWSFVEEEEQEDFSFFEANKGTIIMIGVIAFLALGALAAGGTLLYLEMHTTVAWGLLGGGGGALLLDVVIGSVTLACRNGKDESNSTDHSKIQSSANESKKIAQQHINYKVVTWNVGTRADYFNMCSVKHDLAEGKLLSTAYENMARPPYYSPSQDEKTARKNLFHTAFTQFEKPDIICLQEDYEMDGTYISQILPGYGGFRYQLKGKSDASVFWDDSKFSLIGNAEVEYDLGEDRAPSTIVQLKDNNNGTTICVGSAHLRGLSLAKISSSDEAIRKQEGITAEVGNKQAKYDLGMMSAVQADLYIFAGDFNVTAEHYPARLDLIREHGYVNDPTDTEPTIYDLNLTETDGVTPKPAKLDHIFAKGREGSQVQIKKLDLNKPTLNDFYRPSDHLPVGAQITYSRV